MQASVPVTPGGAVAGGFAPSVAVPVSAGGVVASGVAPTEVIGLPVVLPFLEVGLRHFEETLAEAYWHPPHDEQNPIPLYMSEMTAFVAFLVAVFQLLRKLGT